MATVIVDRIVEFGIGPVLTSLRLALRIYAGRLERMDRDRDGGRICRILAQRIKEVQIEMNSGAWDLKTMPGESVWLQDYEVQATIVSIKGDFATVHTHQFPAQEYIIELCYLAPVEI